MTTSPDTRVAVELLEAAGADPKLAEAIVVVVAATAARTPSPSAASAVVTSFASIVPTIVVPLLIAIVSWFFVSELQDLRTELRDLRTEQIEQGERLTRIETLLDERLPE